jgi:protein tyrosine phosphatase (PTP) superfamily phosphohydrolase (DUF442 family)
MHRLGLCALVASSVSLLALAGCHHPCPRPCPNPGPPGPIVVPPGPQPGPGVFPKGALPDPPVPPAPIGSQSKSFEPQPLPNDMTWKPGNGPSVRLYPPEVVEGGGNKTQLKPPEVEDKKQPAPKVETNNEPKSVLPVGIAQFAQVRDNVATGLRPSLEGLDWLQSSGFKTVIYLHQPGEPDSADRKQVEKRGMKLVTVEVSPATLSTKTVEAFNILVGDAANQPVFVYDRDGALAGTLWYLHLRSAGQLADDAARTQARGLGLREDREGLHREMWQAAQKIE